MREVQALRTAYTLLEPLNPEDRQHALAWVNAMLGTRSLTPEHTATAVRIMKEPHLSYDLMACRVSLMALGVLRGDARERSVRWLMEVLLR
ncbi:hypothetical protein [Streptomyces sp. DH8]|uniref:hypothetical protein n=1 Tax=Streptomyces sp. DH8 TaxID=2857008 RepID=UPI001E3F63DB|nr:hypothetical protein [Streptomyces sp. DH8]